MDYQLQISGQHVEVTEALRTLTTNKTAHLATICDRITHIHITFHIDHVTQVASGQVSVPGKLLAAEAKSDDMYKSIDQLIEKLEAQLRKYKEKQSNHQS